MKIKLLIKFIMLKSGILYAIHCLLNRNTVTTVMFHRVLPVKDKRWQGANKVWTVSDIFFNNCVNFLSRYYNIITINDLYNYKYHNVRLPKRSLLITFDDGWSDNEEYALPVLQKHSSPAVIFVVSDFIDTNNTFWQEFLFDSCITHKVPLKLFKKWLSLCSINNNVSVIHEDDTKTLIRELTGKYNYLIDGIIRECRLYIKEDEPMMLTSNQIKNLAKNNISIGSHGKTHNPLTTCDDYTYELRISKSELENVLSDKANINSLAFPHSAYNDSIVNAAYEENYKLIFGGSKEPFKINNASIRNQKVFGRFSINQIDYSDADGNLSIPQLATRLILLR